MNQILITKKLYITPELKKKKKIYKFHFVLSVFLVCILISFYIYAEYERNKSEEVSQEILANLNLSAEEKEPDSNVLLVIFNNTEQAKPEDVLTSKKNETPKPEKQTTKSGYTYSTIATISIPKINVNYPILQGEQDTLEEIEALIKISPAKYFGPQPNKKGNLCITGHNYRNSKFFSKVPTLENGDTLEITDLSGKTIVYEMYDTYIVNPNDISCTDQRTNGKKIVTIITCTDDGKDRVIAKFREVK